MNIKINHRSLGTSEVLLQFENNDTRLALVLNCSTYYILAGDTNTILEDFGVFNLNRFYKSIRNFPDDSKIEKIKARKATFKQASALFMNATRSLDKTIFRKIKHNL